MNESETRVVPRERPSLASFAAAALDWPAVRDLFGSLAFTAVGRAALAELEPRPVRPEDVEEPYPCDAPSALARVSELETGGDGPPLNGAMDPRSALERAREFGRPFEREEAVCVGAFLASFARVRAWLEERREAVPACARLFANAPDLVDLRRRFEAAIDTRGEVRDGASPRLLDLRRDIARLEDEGERAMKRVIDDPALRRGLADTRIHRRFGRWVLAVRRKSAGVVKGIVLDRSRTDQTLFIEPAAVVEIANNLQTVLSDVRIEETRILTEITRAVLGQEADVRLALALYGELELSAMGAAFCRRHGARVASTREGSLILRSARHPLLCEQVLEGRLESVVPIDLRLGEDFDMLVITGPNTGGKTLALKTTGLAVLATRLGLPFPCADGTNIPLYDRIAADIGDEQEVQQNLSTFASHLVRIESGLRLANERTLVLFDELGGGTDPDEGAALGDAVLEYLLESRAPTLCTTHLGRLKEFAFRSSRVENASVEFDAETLMPLYRVRIGTPGESCALSIASRMGLPESVMRRAAERVERREDHVTELIEGVRVAREDAERRREAAEARGEELEREGRELGEVRDRLGRKEALLLAEAQRGLEERVRAARSTLERVRAIVAQVPAPAAGRLSKMLDELERNLAEGSLTDRRRAFEAGLAKGRYVFVPRFKKRCVVTRVDRARGRVIVRLGRAAVELSFDEVSGLDFM